MYVKIKIISEDDKNNPVILSSLKPITNFSVQRYGGVSLEFSSYNFDGFKSLSLDMTLLLVVTMKITSSDNHHSTKNDNLRLPKGVLHQQKLLLSMKHLI